MRKRVEWNDAEVVAHLTRNLPLARFCLIGGQVHTWGRLRFTHPTVVDMWIPLGRLIEDDALALAAPGALCRAGVRAFRSTAEAMAWGRAHLGGLPDAEPGAAPDTAG